MHLTHISKCSGTEMCTLCSGALWDIGQMHCGICEFGQFVIYFSLGTCRACCDSQWVYCVSSTWLRLTHRMLVRKIVYPSTLNLLLIEDHDDKNCSNFSLTRMSHLCLLNVWSRTHEGWELLRLIDWGQVMYVSLLQIMAWHLFGSKPLLQPMLAYHEVEHNSVKFKSKHKAYFSRKCIWKCDLQNFCHFPVASVC